MSAPPPRKMGAFQDGRRAIGSVERRKCSDEATLVTAGDVQSECERSLEHASSMAMATGSLHPYLTRESTLDTPQRRRTGAYRLKGVPLRCLCGSARRCALFSGGGCARATTKPAICSRGASLRSASTGTHQSRDADDINSPLPAIGDTCHADPCVWPTVRVRVHVTPSRRVEWRAPARVSAEHMLGNPVRRRSRRRSLRFQARLDRALSFDTRLSPAEDAVAQPPGVLLRADEDFLAGRRMPQ